MSPRQYLGAEVASEGDACTRSLGISIRYLPFFSHRAKSHLRDLSQYAVYVLLSPGEHGFCALRIPEVPYRYHGPTHGYWIEYALPNSISRTLTATDCRTSSLKMRTPLLILGIDRRVEGNGSNRFPVGGQSSPPP